MRGDLPQPDRDRLSTLTALVILSYALIRIVVLPIFSAELAFAGLIFEFKVDTRLIMLTLAAALTVAGADWLLRSHPSLKSGERTFEHWIVPGLTALAAGIILTRLPEGPALWVGLVVGAALLMAVLLAEFIIHDPTDPRHDLAALVLRTLAYLLLVGILFTMHAVDLRSVYRVPLSLVVIAVISWRLLQLSTSNALISICFDRRFICLCKQWINGDFARWGDEQSTTDRAYLRCARWFNRDPRVFVTAVCSRRDASLSQAMLATTPP
jgi:hypothetical protein